LHKFVQVIKSLPGHIEDQIILAMKDVEGNDHKV